MYQTKFKFRQDGKTWTFHIRKSVNFANGDPLNADAVVYSVERVLQLKKSPVWLFESLGLNSDNMNEMVKKIDDYTVQMNRLPRLMSQQRQTCRYTRERS
ncbi:ABC transporter substrate-binding protein [Athalassotoga sp.]|uniref:ABC transporter substrate-binding protein n=1 Tax=Athalassotoga sp. TaxID=2022597 RepID=UPI003CFC4D1A